MAIQKADIDQWLDSGWQLATRYYPKLDGRDSNYQGDFDELYFFASNLNAKPTQLGFSLERLKKKVRSITDLAIKTQLNNFISTSTILLQPQGRNEKGQEKMEEVRQWLNDNHCAPDPISVLEEYKKFYPDSVVAEAEAGASRPAPSLWNRFNAIVERIGMWISVAQQYGPEWAVYIVLGLLAIAALIGVISTWVSDGFWFAVLVFVISCVILYICSIVVVFIFFILKFLLLIPRCIFFNAYTLLGTIAILTLILIL